MPAIISKLKQALSSTRQNLTHALTLLFSRHQITEELYQTLEELLITSDVGPATTQKLLSVLKSASRKEKELNIQRFQVLLKEEIMKILAPAEPLRVSSQGLTIYLIVGVNGTGKTTSLAKLGYRFSSQGKKVLLAASDTFRSGAIDQIEVWSKKIGAQVVKHHPGADPGAVTYDAIQASKARGIDFLLIDTAGRLHTKRNLMEELKKITRVINKNAEGALQETLLVLDATTGQNALQQARVFKEEIGITGIILAKLDSTAKGGIVIGIKDTFGIPIKLIGIGQTKEALLDFDPKEFVEALFE
jgi:fused signal recognition particle receptor